MPYPSFKAIHGRAPIAGEDYNPDHDIQQDDYEYYTGTGPYSDNAIMSYNGIHLGEVLREIETGRVGAIVAFEKAPDGTIAICQHEGEEEWGAYLHNCEFVTKPNQGGTHDEAKKESQLGPG